MASSPLYGDRPAFQGARRSITPASRALTFHEKAGLDQSDAKEEVLYSHPNARIFSFAPPPESLKSTSKDKSTFDTDYPVDTIESLPWKSRTEIMIAAASMNIEKVRGSAIFLKCQDISQPILKNSQCWCVDGQSKFVLRVKAFRYNRIELPCQSEEDKQRVEELKNVLGKIMRFERTPCPFVRQFTIDLPDDAMTPRRRGTWKRRDSSQFDGSDTETPIRSPLSEGQFSSSRGPPSSYPRNGPNFSGSPLISSPSDVARSNRRDSLSGNDATDLISSRIRNGDDVDSGQESEHRVVSHDTTLSDEVRGRPLISRQISASIPVSVRIASIERSGDKTVRTPLNEKRPLQVDTNSERRTNVVDRPTIENAESEPSIHDANMSSSENGRPLPDRAHDELRVEDVNEEASVGTQSSPLPVTSTDTVKVTGVPSEQTAIQHDDQSGSVSTYADEADMDEVHTEELDSASSLRSADTLQLEPPTNEHIIVPTSDDDLLEASSEQQLTQDPLMQEDAARINIGTIEGGEVEKSDLQDDTRSSLDIANDVDEKTDIIADTLSDTTMPRDVSEASEMMNEMTGTTDSRQSVDSESRLSENSLNNDDGDDAISIASSTDSFHTMISEMHESDEFPSEFDVDRTPLARQLDPFSRPSLQHKREMSELTVTAASSSSTTSNPVFSEVERAAMEAHSISSPAGELQIPEEIVQELNSGVRRRLRARRSFSPMPPANTIVMQPSTTRIRDREIARTVLQIVIIKPLELAFFLFHVARLIRHGATLQDLLDGDIIQRPVQNRQQRERTQARARAQDQAIDVNRNGTEEDQRRNSTQPNMHMNENDVRNDDDNSTNGNNRNITSNANTNANAVAVTDADVDVDANQNEEEEEDDYGVPIRGRTRHSSSRSQRPPNPMGQTET